MAKEMKYEAAIKRLEEIVENIENDELDLEQLNVNLKETQGLIKLCREKLLKTEEEINKTLEGIEK